MQHRTGWILTTHAGRLVRAFADGARVANAAPWQRPARPGLPGAPAIT
jgi:hypothetical protein